MTNRGQLLSIAINFVFPFEIHVYGKEKLAVVLQIFNKIQYI